MKKIMFNDKYGLTEAVMQGRKTMTRRRISNIAYANIDFPILEIGDNRCYYSKGRMVDYREAAYYKIGEVVAVSQRYADLNAQGLLLDDAKHTLANSAGWRNKQSVKANLMPHQIFITDVRIERLQDISDEDCLKEGVLKSEKYAMPYGIPNVEAPNGVFFYYNSPREAYAALIDKIGGNGTWESNPYVFVYDFKLVK